MNLNVKLRKIFIGAYAAGAMVFFSACNSTADQNVVVYSSSRGGDRLNKKSESFKKAGKSDLPVINIDESTRFQQIDGFGATFNEAGMICLNSLSDERKDSVLKMLFDPESGAGYTLMKSPIAACDFASAGPWYTYNDNPGDTLMKKFSIRRDLGPDGLITFIKAAQKFGRFEIESPMDFAPDWMYIGLGDSQKFIKPIYYRALARYYSEYLKSYAANGVTINYLNLFNEAHNKWYSNVTYETIGLLIKDYVVPQLKADGVSVKIQLGETSNRPEGIEKFPLAMMDPDVAKNINSFTVHGYDWDKFSTLSDLHDKYPDIPIWMTEVCYVTGTLFPPGGPAKSPVLSFDDGEFWGNMIMNDMKNHVSGWIYWNMILDENGGPWLISTEHGDPDPNQQHPAVVINRKTGEVIYTGLYYYLAHFSKFVRPGAFRINATGGTSTLNIAGFQNQDGSVVLNVVNNDKESECNIVWKDKSFTHKFSPHSITTLVWEPPKI